LLYEYVRSTEGSLVSSTVPIPVNGVVYRSAFRSPTVTIADIIVNSSGVFGIEKEKSFLSRLKNDIENIEYRMHHWLPGKTAEGGQGEQNPLGRTTRTNFDEKLDLEGKDAAGGAMS
jgi:hypothetical protein